MNFKTPISILLILSLTLVPLSAQSIFLEYEGEIIDNAKSGVAIGVADINSDGLDDILRFSEAKTLQILLQFPSGKFHLHFENGELTARQWNITTYDLNRDGWLDIMSSGMNDGVHYWMSTENGEYEHYHDGRYPIIAQAANMVDIDKDGFADIFICNDKGKNLMLRGKEEIPYDSHDFVSIEFPQTNDYEGNYGSVWEDINRDGIPDLYIAKCHHDANQAGDLRRINQLFLSDGDTSYVESASELGVADSSQSWSSTFADVDNDGDWDLIVLNHDAPTSLFYNEGGHFRKSTDFAGSVVELNSVQVIATDLDCDGWIDFVITGDQATVLMNEGDGSFRQQPGLLGTFRNGLSTAAVGDLNNDGYPDLYTARHGLYNNPQDLTDRLLINENEGNHYLKLQLIDSNIHISGLHAICKLYQGQNVQMRSLRSGEAYGITNSNIFHFGLGNAESVDSVEVIWPDGTQNVFYDVRGSESYYLVKNGQLQTYSDNLLPRDHLCGGDTINYSIPYSISDPVIYHYENNSYDSSANIQITEPGNYYWQGVGEDGKIIRGTPFYIPLDPEPDLSLNILGEERKLCFGDSLLLRSESEDFLSWNDGIMSNERWLDTSGLFYAILDGRCRQFNSDSLQLMVYPEIDLQVENDTIMPGEDALLVAQSENVLWYNSPDGTQPIYFQDSLWLPYLTRDTTFWVESFEKHVSNEVDSLGETAHSGDSKYNGQFVDGALNFRVLNNCKLLSVDVETDTVGIRAVQLIRNGRLIGIDTFFIDTGRTTLDLQWNLTAGENYTIKTDRGINFSEYEGYSPYLYRTAGNMISYPYSDGNYIEIQGSNSTDREYFYFYNWKVQAAADSCFSERKMIRAIVEDSTAASHHIKDDLVVFPNPNSGVFTIRNQKIAPQSTLILFSLNGHVLQKWSVHSEQQRYSTEYLPAGVYHLLYISNEEAQTGIMIKDN